VNIAEAVIKSYKWINRNYITIGLESALGGKVPVHSAMENAGRMCDLTIRGCKMGLNRARGVLVSTPGKVLIENNVFDNPGAAILIEGSDASFWFESGRVKDVTIKNNLFNNCLIAPWGAAVVAATAWMSREKGFTEYFHRNIKIINNRFVTFHNKILAAGMVSGIVISDNIIEKSTEYPAPESFGIDGALTFTDCENITVENNKIIGFRESV
jgi:polygalacturonase